MLIHKLKPGESLYIRGEIEIKNLTSNPTKLGCIGSGEVSTDVVTESSGCIFYDTKTRCQKSNCIICDPA
jgi:hypothetical protein